MTNNIDQIRLQREQENLNNWIEREYGSIFLQLFDRKRDPEEEERSVQCKPNSYR